MSARRPTSVEGGKASKPVTVSSIRNAKGREPLVCLTAYTTPVAQALDEACDLLLVGDSLGMVVYGLDSTIPVTLDMMSAHGAAVVRGARHALVVVDLPFGSYQESPGQAFQSAARILAETGCGAVKLEGGAVMAETINFLTQRGVPVLSHIGLQPQSVNALGGYAARGKQAAEAEAIVADARAVADAGAFAIVVEGVVAPLAARITETVRVPTIGIGASAECDGQILVTEDMMGATFGHVPKFVRKYADVGNVMREAAKAYAEDVRARRFPAEEHLYGVPSPKVAAV
ncbi:3-methyl-2-oxobutanoate hydroxymethyltransferase [Hansschlegelia quercus]|uniref:3-methyl-2-oxobutanoate hydroxymethyltransferase n=1 Tax=Hansschlegelia quercus TaxID=2528245 RepID=A0A4Q9GCY2_9HYPH|nr:3-methyl-2-oxobutanoate hydroxymethyltransferase [Hansschlegelia quercus]TBN47967.1 3-methyl-2-oxobutanoate hydroxymethyltransferase [Hansschlegelia quercus]